MYMRYQKLGLIAVGCLLGGIAFGQPCDRCEERGQIFALPKDSVDKYYGKYKSGFRGSPSMQKLHPKSIVFSRKAFMEFYRVNFKNDSTKYSGMNLCLVSFGIDRRNGQRHLDQVGIVMAPRGQDCKIDSSGFVIMNNGFDDNLTLGSQSIQYVTRDEFRQFGQKYRTKFRTGGRADTLYSNSLFLRKAVCDVLAAYFDANSDADGLAVYPGVYGSMLSICGLRDPGQITLMLVPLVNGVPEFNAFKTFVDTKATNFKSMLALNHGSLCPDVCY